MSRRSGGAAQQHHARKFAFPIYASVFYDSQYFLVAGGGGKKSSGIRNLVTVSSFVADDYGSSRGGVVSEAITAVATDDDCPQRLAMHPDGGFVVCVFGGSIGVFGMERNLNSMMMMGTSGGGGGGGGGGGHKTNTNLGRNDSTEDLRNRPEVNMTRSAQFPRRVALTADDRDVKCAVFSPSGRQLAIGLETGEVKIVQWPSLEVDMELGAHESGAAVTDIAWSPDERVIVSCAAERIGSSTTGSDSNRTDNGQQQQQQQPQQEKNTKGAIMWSIERGERIAALPDPTSARFNCKGFPSSSRKSNCLKVFRGASFSHTGEFFFCGVNIDGVGYLVKFETTTWTPVTAVRAFRDAPISAYAANKNGSRHACGSAEGDVVAFDGGGLRKQSANSRKRSMKRIAAARNAHMIFVTTISWNARGDVVLSGSADASVYCLHVKNKFKSGVYRSLMRLLLWMTVLIACLLGWVFLLMKVFDESAVPSLENTVDRGLSALEERQRVISKRSAGIPLDDREREVLEEMEEENSEEEQRAVEVDYHDGDDDNNDPHAHASQRYQELAEREKYMESEYAEARAMEEKQKREWELQNEANLQKLAFAEEERKRQKEALVEEEIIADDENTQEESREEEEEEEEEEKEKEEEEEEEEEEGEEEEEEEEGEGEGRKPEEPEPEPEQEELDTQEAMEQIQREMAEAKERRENGEEEPVETDDDDPYANTQHAEFEWGDDDDEEEDDD